MQNLQPHCLLEFVCFVASDQTSCYTRYTRDTKYIRQKKMRKQVLWRFWPEPTLVFVSLNRSGEILGGIMCICYESKLDSVLLRISYLELEGEGPQLGYHMNFSLQNFFTTSFKIARRPWIEFKMKC